MDELLKSIELERRASEITGIKPILEPKTPSGLSGADLIQQPDLNFQRPEESLIPLVPEITFTPQEEKQSDLTEKIIEAENRLLGESGFRTAEEGRVGVEDLRKTQRDLESRVVALKRESEAIPLQLQQESLGRGITAGGLRPIETAALRNNAIQALSTSALLEASRGNLTLALDQVDRAVKAKYDPIREDIAVKLANLDLMIKDPRTSVQDKERARKQQEAQDIRKRELDRREKEQEEIWKIGLEAAKNAADAETLRKIQNATTQQEAASLAAPFLAKKETVPSDIQSFKAFFPDVDITTPKGRQQYLNWQAQKSAAERKPGEGDVSDDAIDTWARRINTGTDKISSVPNNIRNKVIARSKDFAEESLTEDIISGLEQKIKEDALIKQLQVAYPEFSKTEIEKKVKETPKIQEPETKGFFGKIGSFFGSLFR